MQFPDKYLSTIDLILFILLDGEINVIVLLYIIELLASIKSSFSKQIHFL